MDLSLASLQAQYASGELTPSTVMDTLLPLYEADPAAFIHRIPDEDILARCKCAQLIRNTAAFRLRYQIFIRNDLAFETLRC